jgi:hypothetical protein
MHYAQQTRNQTGGREAREENWKDKISCIIIGVIFIKNSRLAVKYKQSGFSMRQKCFYCGNKKTVRPRRICTVGYISEAVLRETNSRNSYL